MTGGSLSLMHVPTGLFAQGGYTQSSRTFGNRKGNVWHVAGGISQNWFGVGKTSLYGEYGKGDGMFFVNTGLLCNGEEMRFWGLGVVQNFDAAALELYAGYRNHWQLTAGLILTRSTCSPPAHASSSDLFEI